MIFLLLVQRYVSYRIKKILKKEKPYALHAHMTVLKYLKQISKELCSINIFYTCHSIPERYFCRKQKQEYAAAKYLIEHNRLQLIALHNEMAKELDEMFEVNNTKVIHNGIDFSRFKNVSKKKEQIKDELGLPKGSFIVGHVGQFHPLKNHKFLVKVFFEIQN